MGERVSLTSPLGHITGHLENDSFRQYKAENKAKPNGFNKCAYDCIQLRYTQINTIQQRTVPIILLLILQTRGFLTGGISPREIITCQGGNFILAGNSRLIVDLTSWYQQVTVISTVFCDFLSVLPQLGACFWSTLCKKNIDSLYLRQLCADAIKTKRTFRSIFTQKLIVFSHISGMEN